MAVITIHVGSPNPKHTSIPINNVSSSPTHFDINSFAAPPIGVIPSIMTATIRGINTKTEANPMAIWNTPVTFCLVIKAKMTPTTIPINEDSPNTPNFCDNSSTFTFTLFNPGILLYNLSRASKIGYINTNDAVEHVVPSNP